MGKKRYTEDSAVARVQRCGGSIKSKANKVTGKIDKFVSAYNVGNGTWGAIDYLVKYHNYTLNIG